MNPLQNPHLPARLVVTGASGFLGRRLVMGGLARSLPVLALTRQPEGLLDLEHPALTVRAWDLTDSTSIRDILCPGDLVCHAAAVTQVRGLDPTAVDLLFRVNAIGSLEVARAALERTAARVIYLSAGNAYRAGSGAALESDAIYPHGPAAAYLASKFAGDILVEELRRTKDAAITILRVSSPYGPGMPKRSPVASFVRAARQGETLEVRAPHFQSDLVWVDDVVNAVFLANHARADGIYNIASGVSTTLVDLASTVVRIVGADPGLVAVTAGGDEELSGFRALNISKAEARMGFSPRSLEEGLSGYLESASAGVV